MNTKAPFVLASNWFWKWFSGKVGVWLVQEIGLNGKWLLLTVKCVLWSCKMISVFILPSNHFWNWDTQREELTDAQREKEREREKTTHRRTKGERSRRRLRSCLCTNRDLAKHRAVCDCAKCRSRSREALIAISRSTAPIAISLSRQSWSREAPRRLQPLVEPSCLSLFLLLSIWPDLMIFFFLGFVCVFVLRNEWYYIFVWQPRKCEKIDRKSVV